MLNVVLRRMLADRCLFPSYCNPEDEADSLPPIQQYVPHGAKNV